MQLIWGSLGMMRVALADAERLEEIVFVGYLEGLHGAGWHGGDPRVVRFGYVASSVIHWGLDSAAMLLLAALNEHEQDWIGQALGCSLPTYLEHQAGIMYRLLDRADEARKLMGVL